MKWVSIVAVLMATIWVNVPEQAAADVQFLRGDSNNDGSVNIVDPMHTLGYIFDVTWPGLDCEDAVDANDDDVIDVTDAVYTLMYIFDSGISPPAPFTSIGCDPTLGDSLSCLSYGSDLDCSISEALIIDHSCCDISAVPDVWVNIAKENFRIWYGHTSHGSQIISGIGDMQDSLFDFNNGPGTLSIVEPCWCDLGSTDSTAWATRTQTQLEDPLNDRNMIMWSWCGQVSTRTEEMLQEDYLDMMSSLELQYPDTTFIYMTGHLDGTGEAGNLNIRNEQIRDFCLANNKILFDFADIESYDPEGVYYLDLGLNDACRYIDPVTTLYRNWADEWCAAHPGECGVCSCSHSKSLNCQLKGRAFWWMMARISGWDGP